MDSIGRRLGLSMGHLLGVLGAGVTAWAVLQSSLWIFLAGMFLLGAARGTVDLGRYAAADSSPKEKRGRAISLVVLGGTFGSITGPSLLVFAGGLAVRLGLPEEVGSWIVVGVIFVLGIVLLQLFLHPDPRDIALQLASEEVKRPISETEVRQWQTIFSDARTKLAIAAMVFSQLAMTIVMTITPVHMSQHDHGIGDVSLVIMAHTLGMFGFSFFTGWITDKLGRQRTILIGALISTVACATAPLSLEVPGLAITLFLLGLGWNFGFVAGSALLDDVLRPSEKGRYQGSVDTLVKLASGAGSLGSGLLFASAGFAYTSWGTILAAIFPALLLLMLGTMKQPEPLPETASS
jgi:MFS family permease